MKSTLVILLALTRDFFLGAIVRWPFLVMEEDFRVGRALRGLEGAFCAIFEEMVIGGVVYTWVFGRYL